MESRLTNEQIESLKMIKQQTSQPQTPVRTIGQQVQQIKVENLDISYPIDIDFAVKSLNSEKLYYLLLPKYEDQSLLPYLEKLAQQLILKDWDQYKFFAHALKGPAAYVGASRLHYACYYIQKAHTEGDI